MKRYLIIQICQAALGLSAIASPFAPDHPATELVVYSQASSSPLHVSTISTNPLDSVISRAFPSTYTGHRAVCQIPRTTTNDDFIAWIGGASYSPGDQFGVSSMRECKTIDLERTSAITARVNLLDDNVKTSSDRAVVFYTNEVGEAGITIEPAHKEMRAFVKVSRFRCDGKTLLGLEKPEHGVVFSKLFDFSSRAYLHEGDFLSDGKLDIDWDYLYDDTVLNDDVYQYGCLTTNMSYLITFDSDPNYFLEDWSEQTRIRACPAIIHRYYELKRTVPTPVLAKSTANSVSFSFKIVGEDPFASRFGTTYTAFKVKVLNGSTEVWNSGLRRLPAKDTNGVYTFTANRSFQISQNSTWRVAVYNAKFKSDNLMEVTFEGRITGDPFSPSHQITVIGE